jgi:hypothetical protein
MIAVMTGTETMTPQAFRAQVHLFQPSRVLLTACELDVFTAIGDGPRTSAEVAAAKAPFANRPAWLPRNPMATRALSSRSVAPGWAPIAPA